MTNDNPTVNEVPKIKNGVVSEVVIGITDTGQLTAWLVINFGLHKQGFGGLNLGVGNNAFIYLTNVLNIVGVKDTESLKGKAVRVEHITNKILGLGNFIEEKWYNIDLGVIQDVPPSQTADSNTPVPNEMVEDASGKKHHKLKAEAGVIGLTPPPDQIAPST